ncbi:hypothetical protein [Zymomonas mobilis]|nr:hypothetical protein [Zymomonas mobilis]UBQ08368.1 hypothetical protein LB319_03355 [Zymomonas mobilis]HCE37778.1 hypothetical protein [Zymomonas mobilis]
MSSGVCFGQSQTSSAHSYSVHALKHPIRIEKKEKTEKKDGNYLFWQNSGLISGAKAGNLRGGWGNNPSGRYLTSLMLHVDTPLASRWAEIMLRRALILKAGLPRDVSPQGWIAARANLLLQLGEADAARALIQRSGLAPDALLLDATVKTVLATADPAGLCPLLPYFANTDLKDANETLVRALCAGLGGDDAVSSWLFSRANYKGDQTDRKLAQKLALAGSHDNHTIHINRGEVGHLTPWRFGMATAAGLLLPDYLYGSLNPAYWAFLARSTMIPARSRVTAIRKAAVLGVFSNSALVDFYSSLSASDNEHDNNDLVINDDIPNLKQAYINRDETSRVKAIENLIRNGDDADERYAAMILTARAASYITPNKRYRDIIPDLLGAMFSAGFDQAATRWASAVKDMDKEQSDPAWILLALGSPDKVMDLSRNHIRHFIEQTNQSDPWRGRMAVAALAGLDRIDEEESWWFQIHYDNFLHDENSWVKALDKAALSHAPATVALLVAIGMQNRSWRSVAPSTFYHMLKAMKKVGLENEARMMAVEMMSRT